MKNKQTIILGILFIIGIIIGSVITYAVTSLNFDSSKKYQTLMPVERNGELYINKVEINDNPAKTIEPKLNMCVTDAKGITTCCHWDGKMCIDEPKETDLTKLTEGIK